MHDRHEEQTNQSDLLLNTILERLSLREAPTLNAISGGPSDATTTVEPLREAKEDLDEEPIAVLVDDIPEQSLRPMQDQDSVPASDSRSSMIHNVACFTAGVAVAGLLASFSR